MLFKIERCKRFLNYYFSILIKFEIHDKLKLMILSSPGMSIRLAYTTRVWRYAAFISMLLFSCLYSFAQQETVSIQVDASKSIGEMKPFWAFFGYDEPNYTTRKN